MESRVRSAAAVGVTSRWLLEGILIIVSVALGFALARFGEYRDDRELAANMLTSLEAEIEHNLAVLEPLVPFHRKWVEDLARADKARQRSVRARRLLRHSSGPAGGRKVTVPVPTPQCLGRRSGGRRPPAYRLRCDSGSLRDLPNAEIADDSVDRLAKRSSILDRHL